MARKNITWLASYPKSGNTWLRAFLVNYVVDGEEPCDLKQLADYTAGDMAAEPYEDIVGASVINRSWRDLLRYRERVHRRISEGAEDYVMVKTHSAFNLERRKTAITPKYTRSIIYMVRNPLDVVISYAAHYNCTVDDAIEVSAALNHQIAAEKGGVEQYIGPWSHHVHGWLNSGKTPRLIMRYEDIKRDPKRGFGEIVSFLRFPDDEGRLEKAIRHSSFEQLKTQEETNGFSEKSETSERFFRKGQFGQWRDELTEDQVEAVVRLHGPMMQRLGYIKQDGSIIF